jgi:Holliday junction resolvase RusA-like endonuclease
MRQEVEIEYKGKLPSVNHMYGRNPWGSTYLKPEGKALKQQIYWTNKEKLPRDVEIGYELVIRGQWYNAKTAKTKIKKRDSNNLIKLIIDACCEALDIDDSQIFQEQVVKQHSVNEGFTVKFFVLNNFNQLD